VAAVIQPFANIPATFAKMPRELASHCSEHVDLSRFSGKEVIVVGAGQSALESAALLHESGAKVDVLVREAVVHWLRRLPWVHKSLWAKLLYAPADVGPAGMSHVVARPQYFRMLPRKTQDKWGVRAIRPAGARWLVDRCKDIPMHTSTWIVEAKEANGRVQLKLNDGRQRVVDHVLLGTGYRVDIRKYPFLSESLLDSVDMMNGYPQLNRTFESSVPGLFFAGAPAAWSYGPLMRFVVGAHFVAGRLSAAAHAHIGRGSRARGATSGS